MIQLHLTCPAYYGSFQFAVASTVSTPRVLCIGFILSVYRGRHFISFKIPPHVFKKRHENTSFSWCSNHVPMSHWHTCVCKYHHHLLNTFFKFTIMNFPVAIIVFCPQFVHPLIFARWLRGPQSNAGKRRPGQCIFLDDQLTGSAIYFRPFGGVLNDVKMMLNMNITGLKLC